MRDKVVVSQDGAEKIEGYFRQVIFERVFDRGSGGIWNKCLRWTRKFRERSTKNVDLYYIYRVLGRFAIVCERLCVRKKKYKRQACIKKRELNDFSISNC